MHHMRPCVASVSVHVCVGVEGIIKGRSSPDFVILPHTPACIHSSVEYFCHIMECSVA